MYALVTAQYGFIVAALLYTVVFTKNAISWTREHRESTNYDSRPLPDDRA